MQQCRTKAAPWTSGTGSSGASKEWRTPSLSLHTISIALNASSQLFLEAELSSEALLQIFGRQCQHVYVATIVGLQNSAISVCASPFAPFSVILDFFSALKCRRPKVELTRPCKTCKPGSTWPLVLDHRCISRACIVQTRGKTGRVQNNYFRSNVHACIHTKVDTCLVKQYAVYMSTCSKGLCIYGVCAAQSYDDTLHRLIDISENIYQRKRSPNHIIV
jgi:hypothetical protein